MSRVARARAELEGAKLALTQPLRTRRDYGTKPDEEDEERGHSVLPGADTMSLGDQEEDSPNKLASSDWITREEMESLCPPCAEKMRRGGLKSVRASVVARMIRRRRG